MKSMNVAVLYLNREELVRFAAQGKESSNAKRMAEEIVNDILAFIEKLNNENIVYLR